MVCVKCLLDHCILSYKLYLDKIWLRQQGSHIFFNLLIDDGKVVSLTHWPSFTPQIRGRIILKWILKLYLSNLLHSILYTSTLPSKCNIYLTLICSFTQHVLPLISHHQVYFTLLKTVNCSNIIIDLHCSLLLLTH
jgi:hypothetical protein